MDNTENSEEPLTIPCGTCTYCQYLDTRTVVTLPGGIPWRAKHHVTCNTQGVVYLLQCPCNVFYVGKTRREFWRRIYDHTYAVSMGYFKSPIGRHIALLHNYHFEGFASLPLCINTCDARGGETGIDAFYRQKQSENIASMHVHPHG